MGTIFIGKTHIDCIKYMCVFLISGTFDIYIALSQWIETRLHSAHIIFVGYSDRIYSL